MSRVTHLHEMRALGFAPKGTFSGFENSFFRALQGTGLKIEVTEVEALWYKYFVTAMNIRLTKKTWGLARDRAYHTTINAFRIKSQVASKAVLSVQDAFDFIYQIGSLWNPLLKTSKLPLFLQVDYTSLLSEQRNSEWRRRPGREATFWFENETRLYQQATRIFTTTENARQSIIHGYGINEQKVVKVGCGVSAPYDGFDDSRRPAYDANKILFVGKGYKGKGLDTLLDAFLIVRQRIPQATLTIVGPTGFKTDQPGVNYLGRIRDPNFVRELYFSHSVFAMPSRFEPLGQVFLEAMACKLPCIGTTLDAMPELIEDGKTGALIQPGDVQQLANHLTRILSAPTLAESMGTKGFEKLKREFLWSHTTEHLAHGLTQALGVKR